MGSLTYTAYGKYSARGVNKSIWYISQYQQKFMKLCGLYRPRPAFYVPHHRTKR